MSRIRRRRRRCRELETKVIQMTVGNVAYHPATSCTQECNNNALGLTVVTNLEGRAAGRAPSTLSAHQRDAESHNGTGLGKAPEWLDRDSWVQNENESSITCGLRLTTWTPRPCVDPGILDGPRDKMLACILVSAGVHDSAALGAKLRIIPERPRK